MSKSMRIIGSTAHGAEERQVRDYYATDPQALFDLFSAVKKDEGNSFWKGNNIWEPACGDGNLSNAMRELGYTVHETDIHDYGTGHKVLDFLEYDKPDEWKGNIVTNPPYNIGKKFIEKALESIGEGYKAAFLMRIQFLESKGRHEFFKKFPPKFVYVFSSRIRIFKNNDQVKYSGGQPLCYAWLIWEKGFEGDTTLRWIK